MIDCYFWTTPNGYKVLVFLEEASIPYRIIPINISKGEQFDPKFLQISPNNKIPVVVDHEPKVGTSESIVIFESGAILLYLADKTTQFIPTELAARTEVLKWLFWQVSGLGPMLGQNQHFNQFASDKIPYAIKRYVKETKRLFKVLNNKLALCQYIAGEYSIADMACYPWILKHPFLELQIDHFPYLNRWLDELATRPAIIRAYEKGVAINTIPTVTDASKKFLFGSLSTRLME
jgi:GST-like protein